MMQDKLDYNEFIRLSECKSLVQDASRVGWTVGFFSGVVLGISGIVLVMGFLTWIGA